VQFLAHLRVKGKKIKVLCRTNLDGVSLKLRYSGEDGKFLEDESVFLNNNLDKVEDLINGRVLRL